MKHNKLIFFAAFLLFIFYSQLSIEQESDTNNIIDTLSEQYNSIKDNKFDTFWLHAPSVAKTGERITFTVQAWDKYERLSSSYNGTISFSSTDKSAILPETYIFTSDSNINQGIIPGYLIGKSDNGKHTFSITFNTEGIQYIYVIDNKSNKVYVSNPILTEKEPDTFIYWGDIHSHSNFSDGAGFPDELYRYAKEVAMLDFAAVTDHDSYLSPSPIDPQPALMKAFTWNRINKITNRWNIENNFVTLIAYEWTSKARAHGYGHYNVYYNGDDGPFYPHTDNKTSNIEELWMKLDQWKKQTGGDVITIPHHVTRDVAPVDWAYYNPEFVPLVEIYSEWGSGELLSSEGNTKPLMKGTAEINEKGFSVQDALSMGRIIGFIGSGDSHDGRPGHSLMHNPAGNMFAYPWGTILYHAIQTLDYYNHYPNGLVAASTEYLNRKNVFYALKNRNCYATSHLDRMIIKFSINENTFGNPTPLFIEKGIPKVINVSVAGDGNFSNAYVEKIELIKNNKILYIHFGKTLLESFSYTDYEPVLGATYDGGVYKEGSYYITSLSSKGFVKKPSLIDQDFYYIRVTETNGEMGWAGPIWVKEK